MQRQGRTTSSVFSPKARQYVDGVADAIRRQDPADIARRIERLVEDDTVWRRKQCINLNCAENAMSPAASRLLGCSLALRTAEGFPADRPHPPGQQARHLDEIEAIIIALSRDLFSVRHVEWRAMSSSMANTIAFHSLLQRGDLILSQAEDGGGNYCYHEVAGAGLTGLKVEDLAYSGEAFEIDAEEACRQIRRLKPRMVVIGGSNVLFPYPVKELKAAAREVDASLLYDAAHLSVLIAAGLFQDPLAEGADLVTLSTHKVMAGPVGALMLTNDDAIAERIHTAVHPTFLQTRGNSAFAALAYTLAELKQWGQAYARQLVANAKALARSLEAEGFTLIAADRGYTETHQVYLRIGTVAAAKEAQDRCQAANILLAANYLVGDMKRGGRTGGRMSVQELTRQGMTEASMAEIARLIRRVVLDKEPPERIAREVEAFLRPYQELTFCLPGVGETAA